MEANRREILLSGSALALVGLPSSGYSKSPLEDVAIERILLDEGWRFAFGHLDNVDRDFGFGADLRTFAKQGPDSGRAAQPNFDDSSWRRLNLPHDWAVELPFVPDAMSASRAPDRSGFIWSAKAGHGFKPLGRNYPDTSVGWYRRTIELLPRDSGKRIRIDFDGVFHSAIVILNGYILKQHEGGYVPFSVDLTDFLNTDGQPNVLAVRVDASLGEGWYYEGAGIYRHVWLVKHHPAHIVKDGLCVRSTTNGRVDVIATIANASDEPRRVTVQCRIEQEFGPSASDATPIDVSLEAWQERAVTVSANVGSPCLWSPEAPSCYVATVAICDGSGKRLSSAATRFGIRDVKFDPEEGFLLNGRPIKIKGTCNHQDHAGVGVAVPDALWSYRIRCLQEMGCNAIRTAHNPPAPEFLDACDRMGMLVVDETRMMTSSDPGLDQFRAMIVRDRNHPSIILWSIGNEEPQQGTARGARIAKTMKRVARELDPTRGITAAIDHHQGEGISDVLDVIGFNYNDDKIDAFHERFPWMPITGTETASAVATRGEYARDPIRHVVPAYDIDAPSSNNTAEQWWTHFSSRRFISGGFIWAGFDYRGEPTPWQEWPSISSHFGVLDTCGFPKDAYFYYRAWWRAEPLLHLFPHWNWELGKMVSIWVFSNCDSVELLVNGRSAGKKEMRVGGHVEWKVPFAPGKIEALGYRSGRLVLTSTRRTAGQQARVVLSADRKCLTADGRDCAVIRAEVVDAHGVTVPGANDLIQFGVEGAGSIIGVGNGDPNCHEADRADRRSAFNGLACAIFQTGKVAGGVLVTAKAHGITPGKILLRTSAPGRPRSMPSRPIDSVIDFRARD